MKPTKQQTLGLVAGGGKLPLLVAEGMREAVLRHRGTLGLILNTAIHFERATLDDVSWKELAGVGLERETIEQNYIESIRWAGENVKALF